jgi:hypothetical protein
VLKNVKILEPSVDVSRKIFAKTFIKISNIAKTVILCPDIYASIEIDELV